MEAYAVKKEVSSEKVIVVDDMFLERDMPTTAGSKMLDGYMSLLESEAISRLKQAGYSLGGKANVGEFSIDLLGESSYKGMMVSDGALKNPSAEIIKSGDAKAALCMDVNGAVRRAAAQNGLISIKPTYGTVSRFGTIPVVCSGETVSILSDSSKNCKEVLDVIAGHDDKDGTSLPADSCAKLKKDSEYKPVGRVALISSMMDGIDGEVKAKIDEAVAAFGSKGVEVTVIENEVIAAAKTAWNILMSAELCNNVSRYDGVKYGYRTKNFSNLDELYTNSRTEAFGELLKTAILYGSEALSTENYMKVYDKCLRVRRLISEEFSKLFAEFDAVLLPTCSSLVYTEEQVKGNKYLPYEENFYTAPGSITGLPVVTAGGVQLIGPAFADLSLLDAAAIISKEDM